MLSPRPAVPDLAAVVRAHFGQFDIALVNCGEFEQRRFPPSTNVLIATEK